MSDDEIQLLPLKFICTDCNLAGPAENFVEKVMTITWRAKYRRMDAFVKIHCPICKNLLSITFEYLQ